MTIPKNTRSKGPLVTPKNTMEEASGVARMTQGAVKDAIEAKSHLEKEQWINEGEDVTYEALARTLLAHVVLPKVAHETANIMKAVAYLMVAKLQDGVAQGVAQTIAELLKHSIATMTVDIRNSLETHTGKIAEAAQSQTTIAENMQKTQEEMAESVRKAATQAKSYSQIAASPPTPRASPSAPPVTHSQLQIQNREQIKRRQILIDFNKAGDLQLEIMDEKTLNRKATDAIRTCFAIDSDNRPAEVRLKTSTLLRNGGLLLELNSDEAASWLKSGDIIDRFLENLGSGANVKNRTYQVIVHFVLVSFNPTNKEHVRGYEEHNNIADGSIIKAEWIKPVEDRKAGQKVATLCVFHKDAELANSILKQGVCVFNKCVEPKHLHKEQIRCL